MPRSLRILSILLILMALAVPGLVRPAAGQTASLVADIQSRKASGGLFPGEMWTLRDKILFSALEPSSGRELWITDGTGTGTRLLADLFPGGESSNPRILGTMGSLAFGLAIHESSSGSTRRSHLWRSDGTREGTFLFDPGMDVWTPFKYRSDDFFLEEPAPPAVLTRDAVYFTGCQTEGCGLWRTDGTVDGTRLVKATGDYLSGYPQELTLAGDRLFFFRARELWTSDGTPEGTILLRGFESSFQGLRLLTALGNQALFLAPAAAPGGGYELWASNGTVAGTRALTSFEVAEPFNQTHFLKVLGDKVYFVADDATHGAELWASNGTSAGTVQVTNFDFHDPFDFEDQSGLLHRGLEKVGDRLIFLATDGITRLQLWSNRGTPASTAPVCPACTFFNESLRFVPLGGRLLFMGEDDSGRELWTTDGTAAGTKQLKDACPGYCDGVKSDLVLLSGVVFFQGPADDRDFEEGLWTSDGTPQGTRRFATPKLPFGGVPEVAYLGRKVVFNALAPGEYPDDEEELWVSDGTPSGTRQLTAGGGGYSAVVEDLLAVGDRVFFTASGHQDQYNRNVWRSDGTAEGTVELPERPVNGFGDARLFAVDGKIFLVWEDYPYEDQLWRVQEDGQFQQLTGFGTGHSIQSVVPFKGRLYFLLDGKELWASDGTAQGTGRALDVAGAGGLAFLQPVGSELWFLAGDTGVYDLSKVWRTDGTQSGTRLVQDLDVYRTHRDPEFTKIGSTVYFVALRPGGDDFNYQIWKSSGTGATMATDFPNVSSSAEAQPAELTSFQSRLYFMANSPDSSTRRGLWSSDGTSAGTAMIRDFPFITPSFVDAPNLGLTAVGSHLVFSVDDGVHGSEPWTSDGTPAGTMLLRDILAGPGSSEPAGYQEAAGQLYFSAHDGAHGNELWRTDGTPQGTRLVQDIAPEGASSDPAGFTVAGNRLFFSANDGLTGNELWMLPLSGPACQPSATALCLNGGRFKVESSWLVSSDDSQTSGRGQTVSVAADTGAFWFFDASNIEVILKVLDGRGLNNHFWVFYGALSNVEYRLTVTDTQTGLARRYVNPPGQLASVGDTQAFGLLGARAARIPASTGAKPLVTERIDAAAVTGTCVPGATRLCLNGGRFAVEASWKDFTNQTGRGTAVSITGDTGYFWFFDANNIETVLKVLDGTSLNGHFWVFYGALSNVEYTLTVTDTVTGKVKSYKNPKGQFASVADTAF